MTYLLFTLGLLLKTIYLSVNNFRFRDPFVIILTLLFAFGVAVEGFEDFDKFIFLPVVYVAGIAFFGFKDRLLSVVTESSMLIHGLVGMYIFIINNTKVGAVVSPLDFYGLVSFIVYFSLVLTIALVPDRLNKLFQAICMIMFIVLSIYISIAMLLPVTDNMISSYGIVAIGFSSLSLMANILYILYLIPIKSEKETMSDRMKSIFKHLNDFERKYIDMDISRQDVLVIMSLVIMVILLEIFTPLDTLVISAIVLTLASLINAKQKLADKELEYIKAD